MKVQLRDRLQAMLFWRNADPRRAFGRLGSDAAGFDRRMKSDPAIVLATDLLVERAGIRGGDRVLDAGTGTGRVAIEIAKRYRPECIVGIDAARGMVKSARKLAAQFPDETKFVAKTMPVSKLRFRDAEFDAVISMLVFHHVKDIEKSAMHIARVMKRGAVFSFCDAIDESSALKEVMFDGDHSYPHGQEVKSYYRKREEIAEIFGRSGLALVEEVQVSRRYIYLRFVKD